MSSENMLKVLDEEAAKGGELANSIKASFSGALAVAKAASRIRQALSIELVKEVIMPLMNCDFGWRTDNGNYSDSQIRDVWVSAVLVGAVPVNNEVNMIAGRLYLAKNYFKRKVREFPGLTDLVTLPGKLTMAPGGALVEYTASWVLNGKPMTVARVGNSAIPVRLNAGMGADGAIGKAERKILAAVFTQLTGSSFADGEAEEFEGTPTAAAASGVTVTEVAQSLPEPKPVQTQTKAVVEKIKKAKDVKPDAPATATPATETEPWVTDDADQQPPDTKAETKPIVQEKPADPKTKVVGFTRQMGDPNFTEVRKPVEEKKDSIVTGELERDHIGLIATVRSHDKDKNPPYTIKSQTATRYYTMDINLAKKAQEFVKNSTPVMVDYVKDAKGEYLIHDILLDVPEQTEPAAEPEQEENFQ